MMPKIFRSYFSRNVIFLFASLNIIISLVIVVIPTIYRVRVDESQILQRKRTINTRVQSIYLPEAIYKAKYLEQLLDAQEKDVLILADAAGDLIPNVLSSSAKEQEISNTIPEIQLSTDILGQLNQYAYSNNCSFYSDDPTLSNNEALERQIRVSSVVATMQSIVGRDATIQDIFVRTVDNTEWVCPRVIDGSAHYATYEYADQYYFPMTVAEWSLRWNTQFIDNIPVLTVIAPIWSNGKFYGEAGISLQLSVLTNKIPQYNLSDDTQMVLLDNDGNVLALPTWVNASSITPWITKDTTEYLNKPLTELMSGVIGRTLITSHFEEKIKATTPIIFPIDSQGETHYFALAPVGTKSLKILIIMPLEDVYEELSFWGDSFSTDILPVIIELGLSILGITLIFFAVAYISIRFFSGPIQEVANTALCISQGDLSQRVPEKWGGELLELAHSFNKMAINVQNSERELLDRKDELINILEIQKLEFDVIRKIVALTNQVSKLSKKLQEVISLTIPIVATPYIGILLINNGKIYQSIINKDDQEIPFLPEDELIDIAKREVLDHPERFNQEEDIYPIYFTENDTTSKWNGFTVPIVEHGQLVGLLLCCYVSENKSPHPRQPFLSILSNYIAVIIENADLQERKRDLIITEERRHMANELHDAISQSLFSLSLTEESICNQLKVNADITPPLNFLMDQTQHIQEEMRWMINELRPIALHRDNLANSLERQINSMQRLCPSMQVRYTIEGDFVDIPIDLQNHLNRIVQEALSNILRHANARNVTIQLIRLDNHLSLDIGDDGAGFDLARLLDGKTESYGIISMYGRTDQIKGTIEIQTAPGKGTRILVQTELTE